MADKKIRDVLVIGGGASGLAAAISAARGGASVTVLEQDTRMGRKLLKTGNGKCNLTNLAEPCHVYAGADASFTARVMEAVTVEETLDFFHGIGVLTLDREGWVYPRTELADTVLRALIREAERLGVRLKMNEKILSVKPGEEGYLVKTATWEYTGKTVIFACGSNAAIGRGMETNGYDMLKALGCSVTPLYPALVPLHVSIMGKKPSFAGVRVRAAVTLMIDGKRAERDEGQIQLTQGVISGIPVFTVSLSAGPALAAGETVEAEIDFAPDLSEEEVFSFLRESRKRSPREKTENLLDGLLPERLLSLFGQKEVRFMAETRAGQREIAGLGESAPEELASLAHAVKHYRMTVLKTGPASDAQVVRGGVTTDSVDPETMALKGHEGLFIAGEMLDVAGKCGGWNLQFAWSSGMLAGRSAAALATGQKNTNP